MESLEAMLKRVAKETKKTMNSMSANFPTFKRKTFLAENIMMLDFKYEDFPAAKAIAEKMDDSKFHMTIYPETRRIAFTF